MRVTVTWLIPSSASTGLFVAVSQQVVSSRLAMLWRSRPAASVPRLRLVRGRAEAGKTGRLEAIALNGRRGTVNSNRLDWSKFQIRSGMESVLSSKGREWRQRDARCRGQWEKQGPRPRAAP